MAKNKMLCGILFYLLGLLESHASVVHPMSRKLASLNLSHFPEKSFYIHGDSFSGYVVSNFVGTNSDKAIDYPQTTTTSIRGKVIHHYYFRQKKHLFNFVEKNKRKLGQRYSRADLIRRAYAPHPLSDAKIIELLKDADLGAFVITMLEGSDHTYIAVRSERPPLCRSGEYLCRKINTYHQTLTLIEFNSMNAASTMANEDNRLFAYPHVLSSKPQDGPAALVQPMPQNERPSPYAPSAVIVNPSINRERFGYDRNGYDRNGYDRNGYDRNGFDRAGKTVAGKSFRIVDIAKDGSFTGIDAKGRSLVLSESRYNDLGYDQYGYGRSLKFTDRKDEKFDKHGFNYTGTNLLGLSKEEFAKNGYQAILENSPLNQLDHNSLLEIFQTSCFVLLEPIMYEKMPDFSTLMATVQATHASSVEDIKNYLIKSITFCSKIITPSVPADTPIADLKIEKNAGFRNKMPWVDYLQLIEALEKVDPKVRSKEYLRDLFLTPDVLRMAAYIEEKDQEDFVIGLSEREKLQNKIEHFEEFLDAFSRRDFPMRMRSLYMIYKIAAIAAQQSLEKRASALTFFLHGGAHCDDAKREALESVYKGWIADDPIEKEINQKVGYGFQSQVQKITYEFKYDQFHRWLQKLTSSQGEAATIYAATWDQYCEELGLDKIDGAYPGYALRELDTERFFKETDGNFTPQELYNHFKKSDFFRNIESQVFGPLLKLAMDTQDNNRVIKGILLRFGVLAI